MRDLLITAFVLGLVPLILRDATLGALAWAWFSMMNPHRAAYGFSQSIPFAMILAIATLLAFAVSKQRKPLPVNNVTILLLLLLAWMGVSSAFALNTSGVVLQRVIFFGKIQLMLFVTLMLVRGRRDIERLVWVITLSIGFYGIKGGIWTVMGGGIGRVWGPAGTMLEENNALAVALIMVLPFMYYIYQTASRKSVRCAMVAAMVFTGFSILGSQSRGALLALVAMTAFMGVKGRYPVRASLVLAAVVGVGVAFMPESWTSRMESMQAYDQDNSAMSRLYTWQTLLNVALDRPLVGAGFGTDNPALFAKYAPLNAAASLGYDSIYVAHSIYFQALGEHGFPGLILFVLLGVVAWRAAGRLAKLTHNDPDFGSWVPLLMPMCQVSLIGFAVGGAFLSMMQFDFPYYIVAYVVLVDATVRSRLVERSTSRAAEAISAPQPTNLHMGDQR